MEKIYGDIIIIMSAVYLFNIIYYFMNEKIYCPSCNIYQSHFNSYDFLICTNCGTAFHKRGNKIVLTNREKSYYGKIYERRTKERHTFKMGTSCN